MNIRKRAGKIKLLLLDVDGVLTDGRIICSVSGNETKNFNVTDGLGIILLIKAGLACAIITARSSRIVKMRAKQLGITKIYENHYKLESLEGIKKSFGVLEEEICFVGDDLIDIPILKRAGLAVCVPGAAGEVKKVVHYVTEKTGGAGAVREVCEIILRSQGKWAEATKRYFE